MSNKTLIENNLTTIDLMQAYKNMLAGNGTSYWTFNNPGCGITTLINNMLSSIENDGKHIAALYDGQILRTKRKAFDPMRGILAKLNGRNPDNEYDCSLFMPNVTDTDQAFAEFDKRIRKVASTTPLIIVFEHSEYYDIQDIEVIFRFMDMLCKKNAPIMLFLTYNNFIQDTWINNAAGWECENKTREMQAIVMDYAVQAYGDMVTKQISRYQTPKLPLQNMANVAEYMNLRFKNNSFSEKELKDLFEESNASIGWLKEFVNLSLQNENLKEIDGKWQFCNYKNLEKPRTYQDIFKERLKIYASIANQLDKIQFNSQETRYNFWKNFIQSNETDLIKFIEKTIFRRDLYSTSEFEICINLIKNIKNQAEKLKQYFSSDTFDEEKLEFIISILTNINQIENKIINNKKLLSEIKESQTEPATAMAQSAQRFANARKLNKNAEKLIETKQVFAAIKELLQAEKNLRYFYGNPIELSEELCKTYINLTKIYYWLGCYKKAKFYAQQLEKNAQECNNKTYRAEAQFHIGRANFSNADLDEAMNNYNLAIDIAQNEDFKLLSAKYINWKGLIYVQNGDYNRALELFEGAYSINKELNSNLGKAECLLNIGNINRIKYKLNASIKNLEEAESLTTKINNSDFLLAKIYNSMGLAYGMDFMWKDSHAYFQLSLDINTRNNDHISIANNFNNIGLMYYHQGIYQNAIEYYNRALIIDSTLENIPKIAISYDNLGSALMEIGDYNNAQKYLKKGLKLNLKLKKEVSISLSYSNIGNLLAIKGDYDNAMDYYQKALEIDTKLDDKKSMLTDYNCIGNIYFYREDYQKSVEYLYKSKEIAEAADDSSSLAAIYNNLGNIYYTQNEYETCIKYYQMAIDINEKNDDKQSQSLNYSNLAAVCDATGKFDKATELYKKAIELDQALNDKLKKAHHTENLAHTYLHQSNYEEAEKNYQKAIETYHEIDLQIEAAKCKNRLCECYLETNNYNEAFKILQENLNIFEDFGLFDEMSKTETMLAEISAANNNFKEAENYYKNAIENLKNINDSAKIAKLLSDAGLTMHRYDNYENAAQLFIQSAEEYKKIDDKSEMIVAYCNAAINFRLLKNSKETEKYANLAESEIENTDRYNTLVHSKILMLKAGCYNESGKLEEMKKTFQDALKILESNAEIPYIKYELHSAYQNGATLMAENNFDDLAEEYLVKDIKSCDNPGLNNHCALSYENLALLYEKQNKLTEALHCINQAKKLYLEANNDDDAIIDTVKTAARINQKLSNYIDACAQYNRALKILEEYDTPEEKAELYLQLADCYDLSNNPEKCINASQNALEIYKSLNQIDNILATEIKIATFYNNQDNFQNAFDTAKTTYKKAKKSNNNNLTISALKIMASASYNLKNYNKCIDYYFKINEIIIPTDDWVELAKNYYELSLILSSKKNFKTSITYDNKTAEMWQFALDYLQPVTKIGKQLNENSLIIDAQLLTAEIYANLNQNSQAIETYNLAVETLKQTNDKKQIAELYVKISMFYHSIKDTEKAFDYYNQALNINQDLADDELAAYLAFWNYKMMYDNKKDENQPLPPIRKYINIVKKIPGLIDIILKDK